MNQSYDQWKKENPLLAEKEELENWLSFLDNPEEEEPGAVERYNEIVKLLEQEG